MWNNLKQFRAGEIEKKGSNGSLCFSIAPMLIDIFDIEDPMRFREKYNMAIGGSGSEEDKITTLHSSSLCALLHFYNVERHPLTLEFKTKNNKKVEIKRRVIFNKSVFEFKSPVIDPRYPSNMDVVLIGKDKDNGENIVFFLESKFAEYYLYANKKSGDISKRYSGSDGNEYTKIIYEEEKLNRLGLKTKPSKKEKHFYLNSEEKFYVDGIKQMISHYCGIRNVLEPKYYNETDEFRMKNVQEVVESEIKEKNPVVILGEIVFDSKIGDLKLSPDSDKTCLEIYRKKYQELAKIIAGIDNLPEKFEMVNDLLCYSTIRDKLEDNIKAFYYGNE